MKIWRLDSAAERGTAVIEFLIVIPVVFLLAWGSCAIGIQLIDGLLLKYGVYEEARRVATSNDLEGKIVPVVRGVMAWSKGSILSLVHVTGNCETQGKDVVVKAAYRQPWSGAGFLSSSFDGLLQRNSFEHQLKDLHRAAGGVEVSYSLPKEGKDMYPASFLDFLYNIFSFLLFIL